MLPFSGYHFYRLCCTDGQCRCTEPRPCRGHTMRTYSGRPSSSMRFSTLTAMATSLGHLTRLSPVCLRAQPVANHPFPARNVGFDESAPVVARGFLPSHAAVLGNDLNVPVALGWRGPGRLARHSAGARRHDHLGVRMSCRDLGVDIVPVERAIGGEGGDRTAELVEQGTNL